MSMTAGNRPVSLVAWSNRLKTACSLLLRGVFDDLGLNDLNHVLRGKVAVWG